MCTYPAVGGTGDLVLRCDLFGHVDVTALIQTFATLVADHTLTCSCKFKLLVMMLVM